MMIICYGDSNTYGFDPRSYFGGRYESENRWVDILAAKLGCRAVNAGENGREIPYMDKQLNNLIVQNPSVDLLMIMLGSNDLLQGNPLLTVKERMEHFLKGIPLERSKILLIAPPSMKMGAWVTTRTLLDDSLEMCNVYRQIAERQEIRFADASAWNVPLAFDGVHFTEEGHRIFAEEMYTLIVQKE